MNLMTQCQKTKIMTRMCKKNRIEFINSEKNLSIKKIDFNDESLMPPPSCVFINMQMRHFNLEEY